jgi:hypothetical protein
MPHLFEGNDVGELKENREQFKRFYAPPIAQAPNQAGEGFGMIPRWVTSVRMTRTARRVYDAIVSLCNRA